VSLLGVSLGVDAASPTRAADDTSAVHLTSAATRLVGPSEVPLRGDGFDVHGRIGSKVKGRPVKLQVRRPAGGWRTVQKSTTRQQGRFRFTDVRLSRSASMRVRAPKWRTPARRLAPEVTTPVPVQVLAEQYGTVTLLPPVAHSGPRALAPKQGVSVLAQFTPAREGREVVLQQRTSGGWEPVDTAHQDITGVADFTAPATTPDGSAAVYRAVARPVRGNRWTTEKVATPAVTARDFALLFEDTFSGIDLDPTRWVDQMKDSVENAPASNRKCSRINPATRRVADGVLHMGIAADPTKAGELCTWTDAKGASGLHPYMWNTQIMTRGKFQFRYGYAAARMKVQQAKGMHSAFWLQPHDIPHGVPALGTEIDVMEFFGDTGRRTNGLAAFVHWYEFGTHQQRGRIVPESSKFRVPGEDWWDNFHVFSVEWTPTAYIFRVDGREFHRETVAVSQAPEYLLLSMLTGDYEYKNLTEDEWTQTAQVDWVRVWQ
jgi:beta-glucanase (GH16 family)